MVRIHTFTGNLLWETTLTVPSWEPGRTHRAQAMSFQVGGKGVNVSKMLSRLGAPTTALFFPGGATGAECEQWIRDRGIVGRAFPMTAPTRVGLVVRSPGRPETTFFGPDVPLEPRAASDCAGYLDGCPAGDVLAVCGSVPGWNADGCEPLRAAIGRWLSRGPVVADTYGPPLAWLIERPLAWVKVNRVEFDSLFTEKERGRPAEDRLAAALDRWPARAWIVTDGPHPVLFAERGGKPGSLAPPPVTEVSPTGSGDILHACVMHAVLHRRRPLGEAIRLALSYAAANAAHPTIADFSLDGLPPLG